MTDLCPFTIRTVIGHVTAKRFKKSFSIEVFSCQLVFNFDCCWVLVFYGFEDENVTLEYGIFATRICSLRNFQYRKTNWCHSRCTIIIFTMNNNISRFKAKTIIKRKKIGTMKMGIERTLAKSNYFAFQSVKNKKY